jgi:hypothetical protein
VPGRYLLQLPLPFGIQDEAESVKFSSKKHPPMLTVTLAVDSSIPPEVAGFPNTAWAWAESSINSSSSEGARLREMQ